MQFHRDYQSIPPHHLIGNRLSTVEALKEKGFPFSFLVIGDTSGSEETEIMIDRALRKGTPPSFMVFLGDFVRKPDIWSHRFFLTEMTAEIKPPFPVFLVSGNHDIDYKDTIKSVERKVTPEIYESLYGARNFDFIFNKCLFIICGPDLSNPSEYLNYLSNTLSQTGEGKRHIFVFIHYPPKGMANHIEGSLPIPNEEEFFSILESHKVTTCFFGDYHGYWRGQRKGVNLIVSGGGGRLKRSQSEWGKFHHILRVNVDKNKISEELMTQQKTMNLEDSFEEWVFSNLFPSIQNSVWVLYLIFVILLLISGALFFKFLKIVRHG